MGVLETVFNSNRFDLDDNVLMEFHNYFDEESRNYNSFSLDEEEIAALRNFAVQVKSMDSESIIYVCTYGYEITNSKGEKSTYADALWIDTVLSVFQIEELIEETGVAEPSDISFVEDRVENGNGKIWLVTQEGQRPQIAELTDSEKINYMIILYWD
ncbi:MAG: hypothetical protein KH828_07995 [Clostridiales bacterium]|nr:hypothetical protein [Clostridiales bacterium]